MPISVAVGNEGYYAEGQLRDAIVELPMQEDELQAWLVSHGLYDEMHEEYYVSDYINGAPFGLKAEHDSLEDVNILAAALDEKGLDVDAGELDIYAEIGEATTALEFANLAMQLEDLPVNTFPMTWKDNLDASYGEYLLAMDGILDYFDEYNLDNYFDFEKFGREAGDDSAYIQVGNEGFELPGYADPPNMHKYSREELKDMLHLGGSNQKMGGQSADKALSLSDSIRAAKELADKQAKTKSTDMKMVK